MIIKMRKAADGESFNLYVDGAIAVLDLDEAGCRAQVIRRNLPAKLLCTRSRGRVPARTAGGVCPASWSPSVGAKMGLGESFPVQVRKSD